MSVTVTILKESPQMLAFEGVVRKSVEATLKEVEEHIVLPNLDVVVADNPTSAIPEIGVGGSSPTPHLIFISLDLSRNHKESFFTEMIRRTLVHECHHAARGTRFPFSSATLLEAFVAEGLADHFDIEITDGTPYPWSTALDDDQIQTYFRKAQSEGLYSTEYSHANWFFGIGGEIPRWAGYAIGFKLVADYLNETGQRASLLVYANPADFLRGLFSVE